MAEKKARDIGVDVAPPTRTCDDVNCPFHGRLSVRGQIIDGVIETKKMQGSAVVKRDYLHYVPKYERYEKRRNHYSVHHPPCIDVKIGDNVKIMECRPLSKSVSFVIIEGGGKK